MMIGVREKVIYLKRSKPYLRASEISKRLSISRERVRQILESEGLPTKVNRVISTKARRRLKFIDSERQPYHPHTDYCVNCGKQLKGRGAKRIDRSDAKESPYGAYVCNQCGRLRGLKVFIPTYRYQRRWL